jgi:signal transduction histidine kinase
MRRAKPKGPSEAEQARLKTDLDRARRELGKLKKDSEGDAEAAPLAQRVHELEGLKERLSKLYFTQLDENRQRAARLHEILRALSDINADRELDTLVDRIARTIQTILGFRIVFMRLREPGGARFEAVAFAGLEPTARAVLEGEPIEVDDLLSWMRPDFKVSHSFFISHKDPFSRMLPTGYVPDLGPREPWEWHAEDLLLVPLVDGHDELIGYMSVDDPVDRLVPSQETVELLEVFATHAVVAIENARLNRQIAQRTRELEDADARMQEMDELKNHFVSSVSHELRTPLTAIRAYTDTLLATGVEAVGTAKLQEFLHLVDEEAQRLTRLIESVLDLGRFDSGNRRARRETVDLAEILEEAVGVLQRTAAARQVELKVAREVADTRLDADRDQLRQLVLHLGSNAIKFTPSGGQVTLRTGGSPDMVNLEVEDTGIGIPEHALEKIFDRFYQVDSSLVRRHGGSGLGLAICKSIVEWHGGRVSARSRPDQGSCFTVVLPRHSGPRVILRPDSGLSTAARDVVRLGVEMVSEVMDASAVSLMSVEPDGGLVVQAAIGLDLHVVQHARVRAGTGVAGWVAEHRRPVCTSRPEESKIAVSGRRGYQTGTFLSVPLEAAGEVLGVINVTDPNTGLPFQVQDCHLLLELAETIAHAWKAALSVEARQAGVSTTKQALRAVLNHVRQSRRRAPQRVPLARAVARELGLDEAEASTVAFAATVHDVGMTMLDPRILEGRDPLTSEQKSQVEQHIELGDRVLEHLETMGAEGFDRLETIYRVREIVQSHHEWWDGSGYPRGLSGTVIPVGARVLAVVDAYESLVTGRPHRAAENPDAALAIVEALRERQFDPDVVQALRRAIARGAWTETPPATTNDAATRAGR